MNEIFTLIKLNLKLTISSFLEQCRVIYCYYHNAKFRKADILLRSHYLLCNPYRVSRKFLQEQDKKEIYTYGETPLTSMEKIANNCGITQEDTVFEMGSGRGLACFWLSEYLGCQVVGIEFVPTFVKNANQVVERLHLQNVSFRCEDMITSDLSGATVVYLHATCLPEEDLILLKEKLAKLPPGTKIITVSYPLIEDLNQTSPFQLMHIFRAPFTWGITEVYLQTVKD